MKSHFTIPDADWPAACAELADSGCKKCYGTGRTGFYLGGTQPVPCWRCVRLEYEDLATYAKALPDRELPWQDAILLLREARERTLGGQNEPPGEGADNNASGGKTGDLP